VFDGVSMQTISADGHHTSFESVTGSFNRFIFIDEFSSIVGWMHGETELRVSNSIVPAIELIVLKSAFNIRKHSECKPHQVYHMIDSIMYLSYSIS